MIDFSIIFDTKIIFVKNGCNYIFFVEGKCWPAIFLIVMYRFLHDPICQRKWHFSLSQK